MSESQVRTYQALDLEIRGGDGRTLVGIVAPFDSPAEIGGYDGGFTETITRGAFARTIAERGADRVKLLAQHDDRSFPIGRASVLREDAAGLLGEFRIAQTSSGNDALELVKDGTVDGFSIGFKAIRDHWSPDRTQRQLLEVALHEVSLVTWPSYDRARVSAVRAASAAPQLLAAYARLHELRKV